MTTHRCQSQPPCGLPHSYQDELCQTSEHSEWFLRFLKRFDRESLADFFFQKWLMEHHWPKTVAFAETSEECQAIFFAEADQFINHIWNGLDLVNDETHQTPSTH